MRLFLMILFLSISFKQLFAQALNYQNGGPAKEIKLISIEGTELLYPNWRLGSATIKSETAYSNLLLKYNVFEDEDLTAIITYYNSLK